MLKYFGLLFAAFAGGAVSVQLSQAFAEDSPASPAKAAPIADVVQARKFVLLDKSDNIVGHWGVRPCEYGKNEEVALWLQSLDKSALIELISANETFAGHGTEGITNTATIGCSVMSALNRELIKKADLRRKESVANGKSEDDAYAEYQKQVSSVERSEAFLRTTNIRGVVGSTNLNTYDSYVSASSQTKPNDVDVTMRASTSADWGSSGVSALSKGERRKSESRLDAEVLGFGSGFSASSSEGGYEGRGRLDVSPHGSTMDLTAQNQITANSTILKSKQTGAGRSSGLELSWLNFDKGELKGLRTLASLGVCDYLDVANFVNPNMKNNLKERDIRYLADFCLNDIDGSSRMTMSVSGQLEKANDELRQAPALGNLWMRDKDGNTRTSLGWSEKNKPGLWLYDRDGNIVDVVGAK